MFANFAPDAKLNFKPSKPALAADLITDLNFFGIWQGLVSSQLISELSDCVPCPLWECGEFMTLLLYLALTSAAVCPDHKETEIEKFLLANMGKLNGSAADLQADNDHHS